MSSLPCRDGEVSSPPLRPCLPSTTTTASSPLKQTPEMPTPGTPGRALLTSRTRSPGSSPARKRMKLDLSGLSPASRQKRLCEHRMTKLRHVSTACREDMTEMYFLTSGSNVIDLPLFRKKPNQNFVSFLKTEKAPARVISEVQTAVLGSAHQPLEVRRHTYSPRIGLLSPVKVGQQQDVYSARGTGQVSKPSPSIPPPSATQYSLEQVQEKIKQEGWVIKRVGELTRDGLWPAKRLPKVVEQPRPVAAWDLVLEEMKWMAADFQQERSWKKSAARVQARAVKEFVAEKTAQKAAEEADLKDRLAQRKVAKSIAEQIKLFWRHVSSLYDYERTRRRTIYNSGLIARQLSHVGESQDSDDDDDDDDQEQVSSSPPSSLPRKRKLDEADSMPSPTSSGRTSPMIPDSENGVTSEDDDDESTIAEQEAYERLNCVADNELVELEEDAMTDLSVLLREKYPGSLTDYFNPPCDVTDDYFEISDEEEEEVDPELAGSESHRLYSIECLLENKERTGKSNGDLNCKDLIEISDIAETHLPKSVINSNGGVTNPKLFKGHLREYQQVGLDWLKNMYADRLPALLADEKGLGRRIVTAAFISYLVCELSTAGPHIILAPASSLERWQRIVSVWCPGLRLAVCSGNARERIIVQNSIVDADPSPHLVLTSYRAFFQDCSFFLRRKWGVVVLGEVQNIVAAGSPDQFLALSELRSQQRILIMTGPKKENPIDLWNLLNLLFPATYELNTEVRVEGTPEYEQTVNKLQKILASFTLARNRVKHPLIDKQLAQANEIPLYVNLSSKQRKLYDDFLAKPNTQDLLKTGDLSSVCNVIHQLRSICNHPSLVNPGAVPSSPDTPLSCSAPPTWCRLNPRPPRAVEKLVETSPLNMVSFENMNLVFLKQELTTTVLTSARLRSIKASRDLIQELSNPSTTSTTSSFSSKHFQPKVPSRKVSFTLEGITRTVNGWNIPGGCVEGMSLVRAASGQVFKVCAKPLPEDGEKVAAGGSSHQSTSDGAHHRLLLGCPDSLTSIAEVNHWRCSGFPLYGQDLIRSLEVTNSVRPTRSRFRGQGYINCLTAPVSLPRLEPDDWRFTTSRLASLVEVGDRGMQEVKGILDRVEKMELDPRLRSPKLLALDRILEERFRVKERVILLSSNLDVVPILQQFCCFKSYRYLVVTGDTPTAERILAVEKYRLETRFFILILAGVQSFVGINLPQVGTVIEYDWSPLHTQLSTRILGWEPNTIFRLLCRGTVEESMTRRALQRRILSELESGINQTTLKKQTLEDLFYPPSDNGYHWTKKKDKYKDEMEEKMAISQVFSLLGVPGGDQPDCLLDLAEFDSMETDDSDDFGFQDTELMAWIESISPLYRYGMKQMTESTDIKAADQWLPSMEPPDMTAVKLSLEQEIQRREEKRRRDVESIEFVTYPSHLVSREWRDDVGELPLWKPPGYFEEIEDFCTGLLYKKEQMTEEELPAVYIKKEKKRETPVGGSTGQSVASPASGLPLSPADKPKIKREENVTIAPKSIFDRSKPFKTIARPRPGGSLNPVSFVSQGGHVTGGVNSVGGMKTLVRGGGGDGATDCGPDWLIQEDWALHQAVLSLQEMPLSLSANSPAHISNWDMVADMVNAVSKCFRSARQCRNRFETTVLPREEGKILYNDITPTKKPKKTKLNLKHQQEKKPTISKPMKTSVLFKQDNNNAWSAQFSSRFETIKAIANKRTPTTKPILVNSTQRNPKHASVLAEFAVSYDSPLSPVQVAANRADRIQREKIRNQQAAQAQLTAQQPVAVSAQQSPQQQQQQQQQTVIASHTAGAAAGHPVRVSVANVSVAQGAGNATNISTPTQAVVVGISQPVQQQGGQILASVSQISNVNRPASAGHAVVTVSGVLSGLQTTSTLTKLAGGQIVVSQAGKSAAAGAQTGTLQVGGRSLTQAQLQVLKTQALLKRQEQMRARQMLQNSNVVVSSGTAASVVSAITTARTVAAGTVGIGRGQIVRPTNVRSMTEPELKAMLAKQQLKVAGPGMVQVQPGASLSTAQLQQLGIQVATPGSSAALVKAGTAGTVTGAAGKSVTIPIAGVNLQSGQFKAMAAGRGTVQQNAQPIHSVGAIGQLMIRNRNRNVPRKLPAQLIVQGQQGKGLPATVTVQQLQQIVKSVAGGGQGQVQIGTVAGTGQVISHAVITKPGLGTGQTVQARVIPVSGTAGGRGGQPTIQVVAAGPAVGRGSVPNVTLDALSRQQGGAASALASALAAGNHVKIAAPGGATQQQILSQVTAALAGQTGQPVSVAVRTPTSVSSIAQQSGSNQTVARTVASSQQQLVSTQQQLGVGQQQQQQQLGSVQQLSNNQQLITNQRQELVNTSQQVTTVQQLGSSNQQQQLTNNQQQQLTSGQNLLTNSQQLISSQQQQCTSSGQQQQQLTAGGQQIVNLQLSSVSSVTPNQTSEPS